MMKECLYCCQPIPHKALKCHHCCEWQGDPSIDLNTLAPPASTDQIEPSNHSEKELLKKAKTIKDNNEREFFCRSLEKYFQEHELSSAPLTQPQRTELLLLKLHRVHPEAVDALCSIFFS